MQSASYLKIFSFFNKRIIEIIGSLAVLLSIFLLLSLATHTPEDPNFIFPEKTKIQNLFGFYGSVTSDLFLQSFGIISFLFCVTIFFTGILIVRYKKLENILSNLFYSIIYIILVRRS
jgi:S-DNA-T family DNA segregation ATPase FtsK/SpoIIIE